MWTVAASHKKVTGPVGSYDSLSDKHLAEYFRKRNIRQCLARVGVVQRIKPQPTNANYCHCGKNLLPLSSITLSVKDASNSMNRSKLVQWRRTVSEKPSKTLSPGVKIAGTAAGIPCQCQQRSVPLRHSVSPYLLPVVSSKTPYSPALVPRNGDIQPQPAYTRQSNDTTPRCTSKTSYDRQAMSGKHSSVAAKANCEVTLRFHGSRPILQKSQAKQEQHIKVLQQHCGGTSRVVFDGYVSRGGTLKFSSQRHRGYAFSVVIFVDRIKDVQLSSCCEYRYGRGSHLGGSQGHFSLLEVMGGNPCYKCQLEGMMGPLSQPPDLVPKQTVGERARRTLAKGDGRESCASKERETGKACATKAKASPKAETCYEVQQTSGSNQDDATVESDEERQEKHEMGSLSLNKEDNYDEEYGNDNDRSDETIPSRAGSLDRESRKSSNLSGEHSAVEEMPVKNELDKDIFPVDTSLLTNKCKVKPSTGVVEPCPTVHRATSSEQQNCAVLEQQLKLGEKSKSHLETARLSSPAVVCGSDLPKEREITGQEQSLDSNVNAARVKKRVDNRGVHRSPVQLTAYYVREKKRQWGPDPGGGESFSSDEDVHEAVVTMVTADVHVPP